LLALAAWPDRQSMVSVDDDFPPAEAGRLGHGDASRGDISGVTGGFTDHSASAAASRAARQRCLTKASPRHARVGRFQRLQASRISVITRHHVASNCVVKLSMSPMVRRHACVVNNAL
jgi:hypothetical protein